MNIKTKAVLRSGYISCLISLVIAMFIMLSGKNIAGSEMVHTALKVFILSEIIGLGIELNEKLKI